jgi:hypothetical protein
MENVVPLFKPFKTIFYFEFFKFRKIGLDSNQVGMDLKFISKFVFNLNPMGPAWQPPLLPLFPCRLDPPLRFGPPTVTLPAFSLCHWAPLHKPTHRPASPPLSPFSLFPCLPHARPGTAVPGPPPPDRALLMSGPPSSSVRHGQTPPFFLHAPPNRTPPFSFPSLLLHH